MANRYYLHFVNAQRSRHYILSSSYRQDVVISHAKQFANTQRQHRRYFFNRILEKYGADCPMWVCDKTNTVLVITNSRRLK